VIDTERKERIAMWIDQSPSPAFALDRKKSGSFLHPSSMVKTEPENNLQQTGCHCVLLTLSPKRAHS
jgi:hypothetical protein